MKELVWCSIGGVSPPLLPCLQALYPDTFNPEKQIHDIDVQEEIPSILSDNKQSLGDLVIGFLKYYTHFCFETHAISVRQGNSLFIDECRYARSQKNDPHSWKYLCIEEPFDLTNTARSVYDLEAFKRIRRVFYNSFKLLHETHDISCILKDIEANER